MKKSRYKVCEFNLSEETSINDDTIVHKVFNNIEFDDIVGVSFDNSVFNNCRFNGNIKNCTFFNVLFNKCEMSNISVINSGFHFILFDRIHAIGINFIDCKIKNSEVNNGHINYGAFSFTSVDDVDFIESNMKEFRISDVSFGKNVIFDNSNLEDLEVSSTSLKGVDVSKAKIDGIRVSPNDIRGLIVNEVQAIELISLLGIVIK